MSDMFDEFVIIELTDGRTYGGLVDEYFYEKGGVLALWDPKLLDKTTNTWAPHEMMIELNGKTRRDFLPEFWVSDIRNIWVLSEQLRDKCSGEDALQLYVNPHHKPLFVRVNCKWPGQEHARDCEGRLHEALAFLLDHALGTRPSPEENPDDLSKKVNESFERIRRRLLMSGARIP